MKRLELLPVAGVVLVYLGFAALTLLDYPPVYSDEPWLLAPPISILREGDNALPIFGEGYSSNIYFNVYFVPFLWLFGVSMEVGRSVSVAHGAGVLVLIWAIAREFGAARRAWIAPAVLLATFPFVEATRYVRPEAIETFYGLLAVWLWLVGRRARLAWSFAAGISAGFAFAISLKSAWVIVLLAVWILAERRFRRLGALAAGSLLGLLPLLVFVATDLDNYSRFLRKFGGSSIFSDRYVSDPVSSFADLIRREPQRYEGLAAAVDSRAYVACLLALVAIGLAAAWRRRDWRVALLAVLPVLQFALLAENKTSAYLALAAPGLALLAALALARVRPAVVTLFVLSLGLAYAGVLRSLVPDIQTGYVEIEKRYRAASPERGSLVIGLPGAYAYYFNEAVDFRTLHYFTDFETFELDTAPEARLKLRAEHGRAVYLLRNQALLDTLTQFSRQHRLSPELRTLLERDFRTVKTFRFERTPSGDYVDTLAVYDPPTP